MNIEIIIPNYNGYALLSKNIPKVFEAIENDPQVLVTIVDDASREDEIQSLRNLVQRLRVEQKQNIQLLENERNMGFSGTVNKAAFLSKAEYLVFLNSDVAPSKRFLVPALKNFVNDPSLFGVGFLDKSVEGSRIIERGRGKAIWKRGMFVHSRGETDKRDTFWISGGSSIVRRNLFIQIGGFDEIYNPFYWEDIDLSYRAQKAGHSILFEKDSVVVHEHSKGAIKTHYTDTKVTQIAYRNQFVFIWKNITDSDLLRSHLIWLPYHIGKAVLRVDLAFFIGMLLATFLLPAIIQKRKNQKAYTVKRDSDFLPISLYT